MNDKMKAFLRDLADLLEKHDADIEASERFIPYDVSGQTIELNCAGKTIDLDTDWAFATTLRDLAEKG